MKHDDFPHDQYDHIQDEIGSLDIDVMVSPYQNLLDEIVRALQSYNPGDMDEVMVNR